MNVQDRDRKNAWKAQQRMDAQAAFPISNKLLGSLFKSVEAEIESQGCDHTLRFTRQWIAKHGQPESAIVNWLQQNGGFCDCEVASNALEHWEENR